MKEISVWWMDAVDREGRHKDGSECKVYHFFITRKYTPQNITQREMVEDDLPRYHPLNLPENVIKHTFMDSNECFQVPYLYYITLLHDYRTVFELGSGIGNTTVPLCEAVKKTGGHVFSIDLIYQKQDQHLKACGLDDYVTWIIEDDMVFLPYWKKPIDHLFIDSSHRYTATLEELRRWGALVRDKGSITLHDINLGGPPILYDTDNPVITAIQDFLKECPRKTIFKTFREANGLGWIYFE